MRIQKMIICHLFYATLNQTNGYIQYNWKFIQNYALIFNYNSSTKTITWYVINRTKIVQSMFFRHIKQLIHLLLIFWKQELFVEKTGQIGGCWRLHYRIKKYQNYRNTVKYSENTPIFLSLHGWRSLCHESNRRGENKR